MDTLILGGDHAIDERGLPVALDGAREAAQRAMIRLSVRRGSFALDKNLGSMLHTLSGADSGLAQSYVQDALSDMDGVRVGDVSCAYESAAQALKITAELEIEGTRYTAQVKV